MQQKMTVVEAKNRFDVRIDAEYDYVLCVTIVVDVDFDAVIDSEFELGSAIIAEPTINGDVEQAVLFGVKNGTLTLLGR